MSQPGCMMIPDHGSSFVLVYSNNLAKDDDSRSRGLHHRSRRHLEGSGVPETRDITTSHSDAPRNTYPLLGCWSRRARRMVCMEVIRYEVRHLLRTWCLYQEDG